MKISISEIKQLIKDGKTDKFKLKSKTDIVHLEWTNTNCDYFDIIVTCKRTTYWCCVHVRDLEGPEDKELDMLKW